MIRVDTRPRKRNAPRPAEKSAPRYLQWLRGRDCFVSESGECSGKMEAAHTYGAGDKGVGTKSSDRYAIPLCSHHHAMQHCMGWRSFEERYCFNAPHIAESYWSRWPDRHKWETTHAA